MSREASISTMRFALRTANAFALDLLQICRSGRSFTDALIMATLVQCTSAAVTQNPELQRRYAVFDTPTPDDLRRAISINALSGSLGLPFETIRRHARRLVADGMCEAVPQGVRLPARLSGTELERAGLDRAYELVRSLYLRLQQANCLEAMELPAFGEPFAPRDERPVRIVWRSALEYLLRMMELLTPQFENLTQGFIVLEVARANTEALPDGVRGEDGVEVEAFVPDAYRRPVRASEIASRLGLPQETVRRNLHQLLADGRCKRQRDGFIVPAVVLARPNVLAAWTANFRDLGRMFAELAEAGVLARWEAERRTEHAA